MINLVKAFTSFLLITVLAIDNIYSQIPNEPKNVQSPNAMAFGLYGDIPVSHYSGIPSIQIPLYTLKENEISVPISLSYHASGFRPDVHPSWVGNNWNLTSGGVITRTVKGKKDDWGYGDYGDIKGYYYNHGILNIPNEFTSYTNFESPLAVNDLLYSYIVNIGDSEPDEYSFNFPGYSGKFYLDHRRQWKVSCDKPIKVELDTMFIPMFLPDASDLANVHDGSYIHFPGFTLTDEFGTRYVFGIDPNAIEFSTAFFEASNAYWTAQAWHLTRIIHADGYEVKYNYERDDYINQMYSSFYHTSGIYIPSESGFLLKPCPLINTGNAYISQSYSGQLISPVYLSSIESSTEKILFKRSTSTELRYSTILTDSANPYQYAKYMLEQNFPLLRPLARKIQVRPEDSYIEEFYTALANRVRFKQLDTIEILNNKGVSVKKFKLFFTSSISKRLSLDSIRQIGKYNEIMPAYRFTYLPYVGNEPPYLANKSDHYGFYNGVDAYEPTSSGYFNRRSTIDTAKMKFGMLESITYPTGGVTKFEYEPHKYYRRIQEVSVRGLDNNSPSNTLCGGLRIKKIESYDYSTPSVKKTKRYYYISNYSNTSNPATDPSSGILGARIKYEFDRFFTKVDTSPATYQTRRISSQTVLPASENSFGVHVGYSEVTEHNNDGSYSKYFFNNYGPGFLDDSAVVLQDRTMYDVTNSRARERGTLSRSEQYTSNNKLLEKKTIDYIALNRNTDYVRGMRGAIEGICNGSHTGRVMWATAYRIYTYAYLPKSEIVTSYSQTSSDSLVTKKYFFYNDSTRLLVKDSILSSKGNPVCNYYYYPTDVIKYAPNVVAPITQTLGYMKQKNMIGFPVQTISTLKTGASEWVTDITVTKFKNFDSLVKPYQVFKFFQPAGQVTKTANHLYRIGFSGGVERDSFPNNTELIATYSKYDLRGNITTHAKDQDISHAYLWKNNFKYPVAKAINSYNNIGYSYSTTVERLSIVQPKVQYYAAGAFRHYRAGNISIKLIWNNQEISTDSSKSRIVIIVRGGGIDRKMEIKSSRTATITNVPPGIYSYNIYSDQLNTADAGKIVITYNGQEVQQTTTNTQNQFFYEGFEESMPSGVKPFAGSNCHKGSYQVPYVVPAGGTYHIDYRYLDGGVWKYRKRFYANNMTINEGTAIDEVRVFRTDTDITTYTYDPGFGLTSKSDVNGKTEKYIYDGLGRLTTVKDDKENILKRICYTYYGQTQNCTISTSPIWEKSGFTRCKPCATNPIYTTGMRQNLLKNNNPHSATYNDTMWVDDIITNDCYMEIPPAWTNLPAGPYCEPLNHSNNTGRRLVTQRDTSSCSQTYNTYRTIVYDTNAVACPINTTNVLLTTTANLAGGYIKLEHSLGTYYLYFPGGPVTNYLLAAVPRDFYNMTIYSGGSSVPFYLHGSYSFNGVQRSFEEFLIGGPNWILSTH